VFRHQPAECFDAVHLRHPDVQHDEIRWRCLDCGKRLFSAGGHNHFVTVAMQFLFVQLSDVLLVVNDQNGFHDDIPCSTTAG